MSNLIYLLPLIAAFIGWMTNYLAIKMLFHPKNPVRLGVVTLQGIFPKRQQQFAEKIGLLVAEELFSEKEIQALMARSGVEDTLKEMLHRHVDDFLENRFKSSFPMLAIFADKKLMDKFRDVLTEELDRAMPDLLEAYHSKLEERVDIKALVTEKVATFSSDKLEAILFAIMKREFRFIEAIGAVLGFMIGLVQVLVLHL